MVLLRTPFLPSSLLDYTSLCVPHYQGKQQRAVLREGFGVRQPGNSSPAPAGFEVQTEDTGLSEPQFSLLKNGDKKEIKYIKSFSQNLAHSMNSVNAMITLNLLLGDDL